MAKWLDPITAAVEAVTRERDLAREQARANSEEAERLREQLRQAQQIIRDMQRRDDARFVRSGE